MQDAEQRHLDGLTAIGDAENTVVAARVADLKKQQKRAWQGWSTAMEQLATAEKDGNTATIAAARTRCEHAYAEFARVFHGVIAEAIQINHAERDHLHEVSDQVHRTFDSDLAILDALATHHRAPPTPPAEGNRE